MGFQIFLLFKIFLTLFTLMIIFLMYSKIRFIKKLFCQWLSVYGRPPLHLHQQCQHFADPLTPHFSIFHHLARSAKVSKCNLTDNEKGFYALINHFTIPTVNRAIDRGKLLTNATLPSPPCYWMTTTNFFWGLPLALRSHDQVKASHWSTLFLSFPTPSPPPTPPSPHPTPGLGRMWFHVVSWL